MRKQPSTVVLDWVATQRRESLFITAVSTGRMRSAKSALMLERWAELQIATQKKGRHVPLIDSLLAATALAHGLTLVTRNVADFEAADVPLLDPWR